MVMETELLSTFLMAFGGQVITVTTTLIVKGSYQDRLETMPVMYEGILLDHDSEFLYLGENINQIDQAINKNQVIQIALKAETNELDEILESMPDPKKEEIN
jgi:hypothetical protein